MALTVSAVDNGLNFVGGLRTCGVPEDAVIIEAGGIFLYEVAVVLGVLGSIEGLMVISELSGGQNKGKYKASDKFAWH